MTNFPLSLYPFLSLYFFPPLVVILFCFLHYYHTCLASDFLLFLLYRFFGACIIYLLLPDLINSYKRGWLVIQCVIFVEFLIPNSFAPGLCDIGPSMLARLVSMPSTLLCTTIIEGIFSSRIAASHLGLLLQVRLGTDGIFWI